MRRFPQQLCRNLLLRSLPAEDYAFIEQSMERVTLELGDLPAHAASGSTDLCFPEHGLLSYVDVIEGNRRVEIGLIGFEGMIGWPFLLGCDHCPHRAVVQVQGSALRIDAAHLLAACQTRPSLRLHLMRFVHLFTMQMSRAIASHLADPMERRLSRWLLMCHDRLEGDAIAVTHDQIGAALGVRRATVTDALHILEGEGAVRCRRGWVTIRDRTLLTRLGGSSYGSSEAHYTDVIAPFGKNHGHDPLAIPTKSDPAWVTDSLTVIARSACRD